MSAPSQAPGLPRANGLRVLRIVVFSNSVAIAMLAVLVAAALILNGDRVDQINRERAANIARNCEDVNRRHDATLTALDRVLADRLRTAPDRAERDRLQASRESTALLITALVPKRDCAELARSQVQR